MRELILSRIKEIKEQRAGFSKGNWRWKNLYAGNVHISAVDFPCWMINHFLKPLKAYCLDITLRGK